MQQQNTSVTTGSHFEKIIAQQINEGRYGSSSEKIRAGLRRLEEPDLKIAALPKNYNHLIKKGFRLSIIDK